MLSEEFQSAVKDYSWLINRGYKDLPVKKFVGDHYALSGTNRSILFRGVFSVKLSQERRKRIISVAELPGSHLHIDTINVLYSVLAYLNGKPVFVSTDGILRDAAEYHGKRFRKEKLEKSIKMLFAYLSALPVCRTDFFIDQPLHNSGFIFEEIRKHLQENRLKGEAEHFQSPDEVLWKMKEGILCTSDSQVIDRSELAVFDLARNLLSFHFNPDFYQLNKFL